MKKFSYRAKNKQNRIVQNIISAESVSAAAVILEQKSYKILEITEVEEYNSEQNVDSSYETAKTVEFSIREKKEFFNSFYRLYNSGMSIVETLRLINRSTQNPNIKSFCSKIIKKTEKGYLLSEALNDNTKQLGMAYTMLIATGEKSGKLEETIAGILKNIKTQEKLKHSVTTALIYPAILSFVTLTVWMIFDFFIMKVFKAATEDITGINIPEIIISAVFKMAVIYAILSFIIFQIVKHRDISNKIRNLVCNLKVFGNIIKNFYFANFFYVLSLSYDAGVPITDSLIMANSVVNIPSCKNKLKKAALMVQDGCVLSTALATADIFSGYAISQVSAGEQAGELGQMFKSVAFDYEAQLDTAIQIMKRLIEPAFIIIIGIIVGVMLISGYKAYYDALTSIF